MAVTTAVLEPKYHDAVEHWVRHWVPGLPWLMANWEKFFPRDHPFCLCAKMEVGPPTLIQIGDHAGEPKRLNPNELTEEEARHLLAIVRAQASTEFGSTQQHAGTVDQATDDEHRAWILRVMAEEIRHGYQMFYLLLSYDWSQVTGNLRGQDIVEELLSMPPGGHVLDAFNLQYESLVDNAMFAAVIDRVGKFQLGMQRVCAFQPFAASMPPMLREEAFHLTAGVTPLRRWAEAAGKAEPFVTMRSLQRALNKWLPRGLEMFGDERGGDTNLKYGFKDMRNREAQHLYIRELDRLVRYLNLTCLRARFPQHGPAEAEAVLDSLRRSRGRHLGLDASELLELPDRRFFRRRGEPAWAMVGIDGQEVSEVGEYLRYLSGHLPEPYMASRDLKSYADLLRQVVAGELKPEEATKKIPRLKRVGGACPCSKSVRWVAEEPNPNVPIS